MPNVILSSLAKRIFRELHLTAILSNRTIERVCFGIMLSILLTYSQFLYGCQQIKPEISAIRHFDSTSLIEMDSIPLRFLPYQERIKKTPIYRKIGEVTLRHQINGSYQFIDGEYRIKEMYPNVLEYYHGTGITKIEYLNQDQSIVASVIPDKIIPLSDEHIAKASLGHFDGEVISKIESDLQYTSFKDESDTLLYDYELFSSLNVAYRILSFQIWGLNADRSVIGFENIVIVLDEFGEEIFKESFDKLLCGSFISSGHELVCLNFVNNTYTNKESIYGELLIKEIDSNITLLNRHLQDDEGEFNGNLSIQEVEEDIVLIDFDLKIENKKHERYIKAGLIDFNERSLYSKYVSKDDFENANLNLIKFLMQGGASTWQLESTF
ncbi:MAG: hypothetical protein AAFN93_02635 [Bacteroidota bacterium]